MYYLILWQVGTNQTQLLHFVQSNMAAEYNENERFNKFLLKLDVFRTKVSITIIAPQSGGNLESEFGWLGSHQENRCNRKDHMVWNPSTIESLCRRVSSQDGDKAVPHTVHDKPREKLQQAIRGFTRLCGDERNDVECNSLSNYGPNIFQTKSRYSGKKTNLYRHLPGWILAQQLGS